jgi:hypothetical protein
MSQEFPTVEVTAVGNSVYRLFSLYDKESIAITVQGLLELASWVEANRETLEEEAVKEEAQQPPGVNLYISRG